mmetsp:Transcript_37176/g.59926  ORF Transcript_37176/g.59926 Transcript_37176/m.59926 type:complete len:129 (-) Transcript_37176:231-617(-)
MIGLGKAVPNELWVTVLRDIALSTDLMPNAAFVAAFRVHPLRVVHSSPDKSPGPDRSYKNDDVSTVILDLNPAFGGFAFGKLGNISDDDMDMALCARVAELVAVPNLECAVPTLVPTDMVLPISSEES